MIKKVENRKIYNIVYCIIIILILFSNFFYIKIENFLKIRPEILYQDCTKVHFIDVGQGDCIAIKFDTGELMLVDTGTDEYRSKLDYYLKNILLDENKVIDHLVLTHPDRDHSSNINYIIDNYNVKNFYRPNINEISENEDPYIDDIRYREILEKVKSKGINTYFSSELLYLNLGDASIRWLSPDKEMKENTDLNLLSPVIVVEDNDTKLMLTGDIDSETEKELIEKYTYELDIDILKLAHHGSKYSNSYEFFEKTTPSLIVASVGINTYGHPANDTLERILKYDKENGTDLFSNLKTTKDDGNVIITLDRNKNVQTIKNIDDYIFSHYYLYTIIATIFVLFLLIRPYIKYLYAKIRYDIRNKNFAKHIEKEKNN